MQSERGHFDYLSLIEAICLATLAEISRQRAQRAGAPAAPRRRGPAGRIIPTSETCARAAQAATADLSRNGVKVRSNG